MYVTGARLRQTTGYQGSEIPSPCRVHLNSVQAGCDAKENAEDDCSCYRRFVSVKRPDSVFRLGYSPPSWATRKIHSRRKAIRCLRPKDWFDRRNGIPVVKTVFRHTQQDIHLYHYVLSRTCTAPGGGQQNEYHRQVRKELRGRAAATSLPGVGKDAVIAIRVLGFALGKICRMGLCSPIEEFPRGNSGPLAIIHLHMCFHRGHCCLGALPMESRSYLFDISIVYAGMQDNIKVPHFNGQLPQVPHPLIL